MSPEPRLADAQIQFSAQLESYVGDIIRSLRESYPVEFDLLNKMIDGDQHDIAEYMSEMPELVDHLMGYGLVVVRDGVYEMAFAAIEGAVKKLRTTGQLFDTSDEKWSEINVRRNNLEQAIRSVLYIWSRMVDGETWSNVLVSALSNGRYARLPSTEPHAILSKGDSPLFFTDLISIIKDERVLIHLGERRVDIIDQLERVNRLRRDAHANEFTKEEFASLTIDISALETEFLLP